MYFPQRVNKLVSKHLHASQKDFTKVLGRTRSWIKKRRPRLARELRDWPVRNK